MFGPTLIRARRRFIAECAKLLVKPLDNYVVRVPNDLRLLERTLRKGDVLLVEGDQRISQVIRYLTQSCWSHCALYIGDALLNGTPEQTAWAREKFGDRAAHLLVEAVEGNGVTATPIEKYLNYNIRICRPDGLSRADVDEVIRYVCSCMGHRYDLRHIVDLARYFFPVSVVPRRWRRAALTIGRDRGRAVICSTLIARGLGNVGYPILPQSVGWAAALEDRGVRRWVPQRLLPERWQQQRQRARFRRRDPKLVTPRDFDLSPYFQIVKFNHLQGAKFNYRDIIWEDEDPSAPGSPTLALPSPETDAA